MTTPQPVTPVAGPLVRMLRCLRPYLIEAIIGAVLAVILVFVTFSTQSKLPFVYQGF